MKPFVEQAQFYVGYHQKPITRYTHFAGIPLIIFSLMIFSVFSIWLFLEYLIRTLLE